MIGATSLGVRARVPLDTMGGPQRRSPRVVLGVPLRIQGPAGACSAHSLVVNRHGGLIACSARHPPKSVLEATNVASGKTARVHVVWDGGVVLPGVYRLGVEFLDQTPGLWGPEYEKRIGRQQPSDSSP